MHRSFGALILTITAIRLLWRLLAPPPLVEELPNWQVRATHGTHHALYVLLFTVPLMRWAGTSAYQAPIFVFGLFEHPPIVPENRELSEVLLKIHELLAFTFCAVLLVHIGAALHYHFVRRDVTLRRILLRLGRK